LVKENPRSEARRCRNVNVEATSIIGLLRYRSE
jgi:hypothetical protein